MSPKALTEQQIGKVRRVLLSEKERLELRHERFEPMTEASLVPQDDRPSLVYDQFVSNRLDEFDVERLRLVNNALDRLAVGSYGACAECSRPIGIRRLRAIPWVERCVKCERRAVTRQQEEAA
jgi:RNA polymerase-binding transcription factor DksA